MEISYLSDEIIDYKRSFQQTIGDCQQDLEQFEASIVSYEKALELADSSSDDENSKNINKGAIMHNMAISFKALNKIKEAIIWYKQSLEMKQKRPDSPAKHYDIANTLNSIGIYELQLSFMNFFIFEKDPSMAHELFPKII